MGPCAVWLCMSLAAHAAACVAVDGDRVRTQDIAAANAWFGKIDPALDAGASPLAGYTRVIQGAQLAALARAAAAAEVPVHFADICVERAGQPLTRAQLQPVLDAVYGAPVAILEFSNYRVPLGSIEFARAGLTPSGLWRGRVVYGSNHSVPIWVKIRLWPAPAAPGLAAANRHHGLPAWDIERGDRIAVEVTSGGARLSFGAVAATAGRQGEAVLVENPENGHMFQAKVLAAGKVAIHR
jgi:Chaperone for flagella basal body P-ring formation